MAGLTIKQEKFVYKYIECGNASEAYRHAYDAKNMKPKSITDKAYELLQNVAVTARLNELKAELKQELKYTIEDAYRELHDAIEFAKQNGQAAAVIAAIKAKIDMFGLDAPKKINVNTVQTFLDGLNAG